MTEKKKSSRLPPGYRLLIDQETKKLRTVPVQGTGGQAFLQGTGYGLGVTASVVYTPFELAYEGIKGLGSMIAGSHIGLGAQRGFLETQAAKASVTMARNLNKSQATEEDLRLEVASLGLHTIEDLKGMKKPQLAKILAKASATTKFVDGDTYKIPDLPVKVTVKKGKKPSSSKTDKAEVKETTSSGRKKILVRKKQLQPA